MTEPPARCTATAKGTGNRCGRAPIRGGTVCNIHGGRAPQVRRAAQMRLLTLVDPAIKVLATEMDSADSSADRQRAANSILDRAGVPRVSDAPDLDAARALLIERLLQIQAELAAGGGDGG